MSKLTLYCLGGLGVDVRLFEGWELPVPIKVLPWIKAEKRETLAAYAARMAEGIQEEGFYLLGVSFGGIIAQEIARLRPPKKLFLISSLRSVDQIPLSLRLAGCLLPLVPAPVLTVYSPLHANVFGVRNKRQKRLLRQIIEETDPGFTRWALQQLFRFQPVQLSCPVLSIHGNADRLIYPAPSDRLIRGGGHFMLVDRREEVLQELESELQ